MALKNVNVLINDGSWPQVTNRFVRFLLFTFLVSLLVGCSGAGDSDGGDSGGADNKELVTGLATFEAQCADCHGSDGEGSSQFPGLKRNLKQDELEFIIAYAMPPTNPNACVGDCAAETAHYVYNVFAPDNAPIVDDPSTGSSLYNAGCASCHGDAGDGVGSIPGLTRDISLDDLTTIVETRMPPINPAACVGDCAILTAEYIFFNFAIPVETPPIAPPVISDGATAYTNFCATCHGVDGLGVGAVIGLTRDLSVSELTTIIEDTMPIINPEACSGTCATDTAQYIYDNFRIPEISPPPVDPTGASIFVNQCATCHGLDGRGVLTIPGVTRNMTIDDLTVLIDTSMPPLSAAECTGVCASEVAQYIFDNFMLPEEVPPPVEPPPASTGEELYTTQGCAGCHGLNGQGTPGIVGVTRNMTVNTLTSIIDTSMPPADPGLCVGGCATDIADFIFATFTDQSSTQDTEDPLAKLPKGQVQTNITCARMAQSGEDHRVRDLFCGAEPPVITSLRELQAGLRIEFVNPNATGRRNNGRRGNPHFAITGHSSSLVGKFVNAINPRAVIFTRPGRGSLAMGFTRGDKFAELVVRDRNRGRLSFFLVAFEQTCDLNNSCTNGDIFTPAIESNWTEVTLYGEEDIKNTIFDCRQCHQTGGLDGRKILRMQELRNPWTHWFRNNRSGGVALLNDFFAAHGDNEEYAGIPPRIISASDPAELEDFVRFNGFGRQPNEFPSQRIENEVNQTPGQPENNDVPGTSETWDIIYENSKQGLAIPPPYHDIKVTDSNKLNILTQAYQSYVNGVLPANQLPDLRDAFLDSRLFEIGFAVEPGLDARGILMQACSQCHNSRLDQSITRSRFNVDLNEMSDTLGGVLTGIARDQEIGTAIERIQLPKDNIQIMPPAHSFRDLTSEQKTTVINYLCSQTSVAIPQCN